MTRYHSERNEISTELPLLSIFTQQTRGKILKPLELKQLASYILLRLACNFSRWSFRIRHCGFEYQAAAKCSWLILSKDENQTHHQYQQVRNKTIPLFFSCQRRQQLAMKNRKNKILIFYPIFILTIIGSTV